MQSIHGQIVQLNDKEMLKNSFTAVHYILKGLMPTIEDPIKAVFSEFLGSVLDHYLLRITWDDSAAIPLIELFSDSTYIFKD